MLKKVIKVAMKAREIFAITAELSVDSPPL